MHCEGKLGSSLNQASITTFFPRQSFQQPDLDVKVDTAHVESVSARKRTKLLEISQKGTWLFDGDNSKQAVLTARRPAAKPVQARLLARPGGACSGGEQTDATKPQAQRHSEGCTVVLGGEGSGGQDSKAACSDSEDSSCSYRGSEGSAGRLQAYELKREERIRQNKEVMRSMGLDTIMAGLDQATKEAQPRRKARKQGTVRPARQYPLRNRGQRLVSPETGGAGADTLQVEDGIAESYDDSSVLNYTFVERSPMQRDMDEDLAGPPRSLEKLSGNLWDQSLVQMYSLDVRGNLLAAGGKAGIAAVWGLRGMQEGVMEADREPLLSAKLHKGWIADVQLCRSADAGSNMLTAGNDAVLALWDLSKVACESRQPQCLAQTNSLHAGGIFSMHLHEESGRVLTASKDESVAVTNLHPGGSLELLRTFEQQHSGVVKCARWRDAEVFASCGNDRCIRLMDMREARGNVEIQEAHSAAVSFLQWSPCNANLLMSTAFDSALHVFDIRNTTQPLLAFRGHTQGRVSKIYQPALVAGGAAIVSGGPGSHQLSLYCLKSGRTLSRGDAGVELLASRCTGKHLSAAVACAAGRSVSFYRVRCGDN